MTESHCSTVTAPRQLILGVAASDAHAVANQLIAKMLRQQGFAVVNLGVCTTLEEFADACEANPWVEAVIVGSLNGHAYEDLQGLAELKRAGRITCPVIVGGNLSVGSRKDTDDEARLRELGVDVVLTDPYLLPATLNRLAAERAAERAPEAMLG